MGLSTLCTLSSSVCVSVVCVSGRRSVVFDRGSRDVKASDAWVRGSILLLYRLYGLEEFRTAAYRVSRALWIRYGEVSFHCSLKWAISCVVYVDGCQEEDELALRQRNA